MVTLTATNPTLLDLAQASDPDGKVATVIEMLHEVNEIMADWTFVEGNLPTGHRSVIRAGLPGVTWRKLYGGVQPDKSQRTAVTDTCGMLAAYNEVDADLVELNGNTNEFRLSEASAQVESIGQELVNTLFHGTTAATPERFDGFDMRFNDTTAANGENIILGGSAGGQTDNASIWLIGWGVNTVHGIIPKGSTAGLTVEDKGKVTVEDASGGSNTGRMEAYRMYFAQKAGLCLKDWRYVVRIPNIDRSLLTADASGGANLPELMFEALERLPSMANIRPAFYMDRSLRTKFRQQLAHETKQSTLQYENVGGVRSVMFNDVPIRRCDALAPDEARVA